jgi:hypothetical protein
MNDRLSDSGFRSNRRLWAAGLVTAIVFGNIISRAAVARAQTEQQKKPSQHLSKVQPVQLDADTLVLSLTTNDQKLASVELDISEEIEAPGVISDVIHSIPLGNGRATRISLKHWDHSIAHVVFTPDNLRYDYLDDSGKCTRILCKHFDVWTEYLPPFKIKKLRRSDQMPAIPPIDPRDSFSHDIRGSFADTLRKARVLGKGYDQVNGSTIYKYAIDLPDKQRLELRFDPDAGLLPTYAAQYLPDGRLFSTTELMYRHIAERDAWLLDRRTAKYYIAAKLPPDLASAVRDTGDGPKLIAKLRCTRFNLLSPDLAAPLLTPSGADTMRTLDATSLTDADLKLPTLPRKARADEQPQRRITWSMLIGINIVVAVGLVTLVVLKRR